MPCSNNRFSLHFGKRGLSNRIRHMNKKIFVSEEAQKIVSKYKISNEDAKKRLEEELSKNNQLLSAIDKAASLKEIERLAVYVSFIKKFKKDVYYFLRQYHQKGTSSEEHISTKERLPYVQAFNDQIVEKYGNVRNIIDVGGGVYPLTFPFEKFSQLEHYVWIDKDPKAYETLLKLENPKLVLYNESIGDRFWEKYLPENISEFDLALMIKLVSVVWRQERDLVSLLTEVPAKTILVTAPKESMTKKESIERRERSVLEKFITLSGRTVVGELDIENEFGYFIV